MAQASGLNRPHTVQNMCSQQAARALTHTHAHIHLYVRITPTFNTFDLCLKANAATNPSQVLAVLEDASNLLAALRSLAKHSTSKDKQVPLCICCTSCSAPEHALRENRCEPGMLHPQTCAPVHLVRHTKRALTLNLVCRILRSAHQPRQEGRGVGVTSCFQG